MSPSVLFGIHDPVVLDMYESTARARGWSYESAQTLDALLERAASGEHAGYVMDANFRAGSLDIEPAQRVYSAVRERVDARAARFMAVSSSVEVVLACGPEGIPATFKPRFDLYSFLG